MKKEIFLAVTLALSACGGGQSANVVGEAPTAIPEKPIKTEQTVRRYLKSTLKDPDSMKGFEITEPRMGKYYGGMFNGFKKVPAWYVCYTYNAKNSYGGYTGYKTDVAFFTGNAILQAPNNPREGVYGDGWSEFSCF